MRGPRRERLGLGGSFRSALSLPAAGGSISLLGCTWMWDYLTAPAVPPPPLPLQDGSGALHLAQFGLSRASSEGSITLPVLTPDAG